MSSNQCLVDRIEKTEDNWVGESTLKVPFKNPISKEEAHAVAMDILHHVQTSSTGKYVLVDNSDEDWVRYQIMPTDGKQPHYLISTGFPNRKQDTVHVIKTVDCEHSSELIMNYSPNGTLDNLMEAREIKAMLNDKGRWALNIGIGVAEVAAFWPVVMGAAEAAGVNVGGGESLPMWTVIPMGLGWAYALADGIYRIGQNVSVWNSGILKKIERKNPAYGRI